MPCPGQTQSPPSFLAYLCSVVQLPGNAELSCNLEQTGELQRAHWGLVEARHVQGLEPVLARLHHCTMLKPHGPNGHSKIS